MTSLTTGAKNRTFSVCGFREILTVWSRNPEKDNRVAVVADAPEALAMTFRIST